VATLRARRSRAPFDSGLVRVSYPGGEEVTVPSGSTLLEASRRAGVALESECGGRGRCSTCRVRVERGIEALPAPCPDELAVLRRIGAAPDVRLACQLRLTADASITPLLPAGWPGVPPDVFPQPGRERDVAVLFADLRAFTQVAEPMLPYDVVFFLNRYFKATGEAIERAGGVPTQFTGDGVMALFGIESMPEEGCRRALLAAAEMVRAVAALGARVAEALGGPIRLGIGIHTGPAVVGHMGYGTAVHLAAVGDTVHVASRLEQLTKQYHCPLVISALVGRRSGLDLSPHPRHELAVRHRREPLAIHAIDDVARLVAPLSGALALPGPRGP
jgi:adenylate cyclase